jgi:hypothetical protein
VANCSAELYLRKNFSFEIKVTLTPIFGLKADKRKTRLIYKRHEVLSPKWSGINQSFGQMNAKSTLLERPCNPKLS